MEVANNLGVTVISAIHDLNIAAVYCEYIFALKNGKLFAQGKPADIMTADIIRDLYGVNAKVEKTEDGIWIRYIGLAL